MDYTEILTKQDLFNFERRLFQKLDETNAFKKSPKLLRSKDVCELLSISPSTLQNLRIKEIIPYIKIGGTIFYDREDLEGAIRVHSDKFQNRAPRS